MNTLKGTVKLAAVALLVTVGMPFQIVGNLCRSRMARVIPVIFHRTVSRIIGVRIDTRGAPPGPVPTLVVSNHVSWLDIVVISSLQPVSFIAKSEVETWPVFGLLARLQNSVFIDRQRRGATVEANDAIAQRLTNGDAMILFAEGTTGDGNRILPFRSALIGAAQAVLAASEEGESRPVEIKPLAITYTRRNGLPITRRDRPKIAWYGDMDLAPHLWALLREGTIDVTVTWGDPIPLGPGVNRKAAAAAAHDAIRRILRQ